MMKQIKDQSKKKAMQLRVQHMHMYKTHCFLKYAEMSPQ